MTSIPYSSAQKGKLSIEDQLEGKTEPYTQFSDAMSELGVTMIPAGPLRQKAGLRDYGEPCKIDWCKNLS